MDCVKSTEEIFDKNKCPIIFIEQLFIPLYKSIITIEPNLGGPVYAEKITERKVIFFYGNKLPRGNKKAFGVLAKIRIFGPFFEPDQDLDKIFRLQVEPIEVVQILKNTVQEVDEPKFSPFIIAEYEKFEREYNNAKDKIDEIVQDLKEMEYSLYGHNKKNLESVMAFDQDDPEFLLYKLLTNVEDHEYARDILFEQDFYKALKKYHDYRIQEVLMEEYRFRLQQKTQKKFNDINKKVMLNQMMNNLQQEINSLEEKNANKPGKNSDNSNDFDSDSDNTDNYLSKILMAKHIPENVQAKLLEEYKKATRMTTMSPEYSHILDYIDTVLSLPWNNLKNEESDIKQVEKILNNDNYGLPKIKERILEFIATKIKTNYKNKGMILCLIGPPGVGKTSIAQSIAHAIDKEFIRISLGGVSDEAEIRGHRRTYLGSMPGRIIYNLSKCKTNNPVFLLDEIDKITKNSHGNPESALLEVLDYSQNSTFRDNYLEIPYDLSNIMFIATANDIRSISPVLLDRMEIIEIKGYSANEKYNIAKGFLIPKQEKENGLNDNEIEFTEESIKFLINEYTMESGVRRLEQKIAGICRKFVKLQLGNSNNETEKEAYKITPDVVREMLGPPKILEGAIMKKNAVGCINGLSYSELGGDVLLIEGAIVPGEDKPILTGNLGKVISESIQIAYNVVKSMLPDMFKEKKDESIHIHMLEGAVKKDGPSAGIALTTLIYSLYTKKLVRCDLAMTGEISLSGNVLPIGGVKEKLLGAIRRKIKTVILPEDNRLDFEELEDEIKEAIDVIFVNRIEQVLEVALV